MSPLVESVVLANKAMLVVLNISQWTARKFDRKVSDEVALTHDTVSDKAGRYNKILIAHEAILEVGKVATEARLFHYANTLPWADEGGRILPAMNYWEYCNGMRTRKHAFERAVAKFVSNYEDLKDEAKLRLKTLFNEKDYPPVSEIEHRYSFRTAVTPMPTAADFRVSLQADEMDMIKRDIEERMQEAQNVVLKDLCARFRDPIGRMAERLSEPDNLFKNSLVGNLVELVELLPRLNVTGDEKLEELRREVEAKLIKYTPDTLRVNQSARKEVATEAQAILKRMDFYFGG